MIINTTMKYTFKWTILALFGLVMWSGCVDNTFDEPDNKFTISDDQIVDISFVLDQFNYSTPSREVTFDTTLIGSEPTYIKAIVTADDASGNFYKSITFQDETGALSIVADQNELNAAYPEGSIIYIKLNGLSLGLTSNLPQLGIAENGDINRIPDPLVREYIFSGGATTEIIEPELVTFDQLESNPRDYYNKLIKFEQVEFTLAFAGTQFADPDNPDGPDSKNAIIQDCDDNELIVRNSGFADFASEIIPTGSGMLTGVFSVFNSDFQIFIRDLDDIVFGPERCDGSGNQAENEITIQSIRELYDDLGANSVPEGYIQGVVVSDASQGQVNNRNIFIQNDGYGILVRFASQHSYNLGDRLQITVTDQELSEFNGLLQINNVSQANVINLGNVALPTPIVVTVNELLNNFYRYEGSRIKIEGATLSGAGGQFSNGVTVDYGTGTIALFTSTFAEFANDEVPSGTVNITALVSEYTDSSYNPQLLINDPSTDIEGGTTGNGGDKTMYDFEGLGFKEPLNLDGWMNIAAQGSRVWYSADFDGNGFAECEAYQDTDPITDAYLITPVINTAETNTISFESAQAYWEHSGLTVLISEDFTNFEDADWVEMDIPLANDSNDFFEWVSSGDIELDEYKSGMVRVAFRYQGTAASNTTKVRIDNLVIK